MNALRRIHGISADIAPGFTVACSHELDNPRPRWHQDRSVYSNPARPDETVSAESLHMVERPDLWHPVVDMALRRTGRRGRAGQSLLPHQGPQDRSDGRLRTALGSLQRVR